MGGKPKPKRCARCLAPLGDKHWAGCPILAEQWEPGTEQPIIRVDLCNDCHRKHFK